MITNSNSLPVSAAATLACLYEATAYKPGNVHPAASFDEVTDYAAFVTSAVVMGPAIACAPEVGVGQAVLDAVRATREQVRTNTNLGTILLLGPIAAVRDDTSLVTGIGEVLARLRPIDTRNVYEAIRLANAGGLGEAAEADVRDDPPPDLTLVDVMRLAADRDLVARQYANNFADVFAIASWIESALSINCGLEQAIVHAFVRQLSVCPDSLIQRKCGVQVAKEGSDRAAGVLNLGPPGDAAYEEALTEFDRWLRADGHRRNPGTSADLIAAALFVLLREGRLHWSVW
jgi:triphosphoribosyl-dephospho-CoA synthase